MVLFIWLATAMDCTDSSLVATENRLLLQSRDEAKWLPCPSFNEFLITMLDHGWTVYYFPYTHTGNSILPTCV